MEMEWRMRVNWVMALAVVAVCGRVLGAVEAVPAAAGPRVSLDFDHAWSFLRGRRWGRRTARTAGEVAHGDVAA